MSATAAHLFDINETSKATGLTASVLRIWELRYGWPNPKRRINGYRFYYQHQIDDLCKVAALVKDGMSISSILVEGSPRWNASADCPKSARLLPQTHSLPVPRDLQHAALQRELIKAFVNLDSLAVKGLLPRIYWSVRPSDEAETALVPVLVAMSELRAGKQIMADADEISQSVHERCIQLIRMQQISGTALQVVPARVCDQALAALTAAMLCFRGSPARLWSGMGGPAQPYLVADDSGGVCQIGALRCGTITSLFSDQDENRLCLAQLLDRDRPLPWDLPQSAATRFQDASDPGTGTMVTSRSDETRVAPLSGISH